MKEKKFSDLIKESIELEENKIEDERLNGKKSFDFMEFRKKLKRNFFAGFGIGLILAAVAFWFFQPQTRKDEQIQKEKEIEEMRNSEIIEKAKGLGMIFKEELNQDGLGIDESNN